MTYVPENYKNDVLHPVLIRAKGFFHSELVFIIVSSFFCYPGGSGGRVTPLEGVPSYSI